MTVIGPIDLHVCGCDSDVLLAGLISYDEALQRVMVLKLPVRGVESVPLRRATGRVLAEPVSAATALPPFDNSAMDGYAIRLDDLKGEGPWLLRLTGLSAAGIAEAISVAPGCAVRVLTGARLPEGADAVVMQEAVQVSGNGVVLRVMPKRGANIRYAGGELAAGAAVLQSSQAMGPRQIALAATAGASHVKVQRKVRVAMLTTGDELRAPGEALRPGQICDANAPMLQAEFMRPDVMLVETMRVGDNCRDLASHIAWASERADLVVTTGGASVGDADHLAETLTLLGARKVFHGVAIKPGKPVSLAELRGVPVIGLPGNPVAAYVTWMLLGRVMLNRLAGLAQVLPRRRLAVAACDLRHKPGRCEFRPARITGLDATGREVVDAGEATHSARLSILERADGLALIPAESDLIRTGDLVEFLPL